MNYIIGIIMMKKVMMMKINIFIVNILKIYNYINIIK